ncbi:HAD family hydrolase [Sphingomicrobium marinum]|uniref:HAD family hydrolase n=1 Tax=Sphingomicrobium marinum TaxID=1227950 RepID=UPI00223ECA8C|nr:HAD family hydrolase [Sphingomicrobium marinum]
MSRPLLISDCDEVLLHMVSHFDDWLGEEHGIDFAFASGQFADALTYRVSGDVVPEDQVWPLLEAFFREGMDRQTLVPGALEALGTIGEVADIVILTNIGDEAHHYRVAQLEKLGIRHEVVTNRGGKGRPAKALVDQYGAPRAAFVDDLAFQHKSVAKYNPDVWRLHMVAEPRLAPNIEDAQHADARIDDWGTATGWLIDRLEGK